LTDPWGTVINPLWAVILEKLEKAWRSAEWTDTRSVFEYTNVARLFLEREERRPHMRRASKGTTLWETCRFL